MPVDATGVDVLAFLSDVPLAASLLLLLVQTGAAPNLLKAGKTNFPFCSDSELRLFVIYV